MTSPRTIESVTCLGCGCGCDDLRVKVSGGRIVDVSPDCPVSRAWFGDGTVPAGVTRAGKPVTFDQAMADAADALAGARARALVYVGPDLSVQAQQVAVAIADVLACEGGHRHIGPAAPGLLAAQRRGRAAATLGELRNRADVVLFWGVDPRQRYPRFFPRFIEAAGTHVASGRSGRRLISVTVGADRGPAGAEVEISLDPDQEIAALGVMRATVLGNSLDALSPAPGGPRPGRHSSQGGPVRGNRARCRAGT